MSLKFFIHIFTVILISNIQLHASPLMEALDDFQCKQWQSAADKLYVLRKQGAIIPFKYLEYMKTDKDFAKEHGIVNIPDDYCDDYDPVPERGLKLSQDNLNVSLAFIKFQSAKTKNESAKAVEDLYTKACNGNTHAITIIDQILTKNPNAFASIKKCKHVKNISYFNKYISNSDDIFSCWGVIDPARLYWLIGVDASNFDEATKNFYKSINAFKINVTKHPTQTITIIENMAKHPTFSLNPFWLHLAFENGLTFVCPDLFEALWDKDENTFENGIKSLSSRTLKNISLACYYASKIKPNDEIKKEELSEILTRQSQVYTISEKVGRKETQRLRRFFEIWAETHGSAEDHYNYAQMMRSGEGGPVNLEGAFKFYEMSAQQEYPDAQYALGVMFHRGWGVEQDLSKAYIFFEKAAKTLRLAKSTLAPLLYLGEGCTPNIPLAIEYALSAADEGEVDSYYNAGAMLYNNDGDTKTILKYFKLAADLGDHQAEFAYAQVLLETNDQQNRNEALIYLKRSASANNLNAIILLHSLKTSDQCAVRESMTQATSTSTTTTATETQPTEPQVREEFETIPLLEEEQNEEPSLPSLPVIEVDEPNLIIESPLTPLQNDLEPKDTQENKIDDVSEQALEKELEEYKAYEQQELSKHTEMRKKKLEQKQARVELRFKKANEAKKGFKISNILLDKKPKITVSKETIEFVKIVFGDGDNKFINYTNEGKLGAKGIFQDLGCVVKQKKNENSTLLSFDLGDERIVKLKYHNPHPDDNLYFAMKRYMKRFLECIDRTPQTLMAK